MLKSAIKDIMLK